MIRFFIFLILFTSFSNAGSDNISTTWKQLYTLEYRVSTYSDIDRLQFMKDYLKLNCSKKICQEYEEHILSYLFFRRVLINRNIEYKEMLVKLALKANAIMDNSELRFSDERDKLCLNEDKKGFIAYPFCISFLNLKYIHGLDLPK